MDITLERLSILVDEQFEKLYKKYKDLLDLAKPEYGFLSEDCYTPYGAIECFATIEYSLKGILEIYNKLLLVKPKEIHQQLGLLYLFESKIRGHYERINLDSFLEDAPIDINNAANQEIVELMKTSFSEVGTLLNDCNKFLSKFNYKLSNEYRSNSATLILSELMLANKSSQTTNPPPDEAIFNNLNYGNTQTLEQIASLVCQATSKAPRDIAFIAIGVDRNNQLIITTNYHSPVIYRLADMLDQNRYFAIERLRDQFRKTNASHLTFTPKIHAETLLAALAEPLRIKNILIIDGYGRKKQNCVFCAQFLQHHGFQSEPHMELIKNYETPTQTELAHTIAWYQYLTSTTRQQIQEEKNHSMLCINNDNKTNKINVTNKGVKVNRNVLYQNLYQMLDPASQYQILNTQDRHILQPLFNIIKRDYPPVYNERLTDTYHFSEQLAHPLEKKLKRTLVNNKKEVIESVHHNDKLSLFIDSRLKKSTNNAKRLSPVDPNSPRSSRLAELTNNWLNQANNTEKVTFDEIGGMIELTRNIRAMN